MSFGAGHIMDMINRIKQNRAQRPSNRSKFKENNRDGIYSTEKKLHTSSFKTIPESELLDKKKQIREHARAYRKKERIFYGIFFVCALIILIFTLVRLR